MRDEIPQFCSQLIDLRYETGTGYFLDIKKIATRSQGCLKTRPQESAGAS